MYPGFAAVPLRPASARHPLTSLTGLAIGVAVCCVAWIATAISYLISTLHVDHVVDRLAGGQYLSNEFMAQTFHRHHVVYAALDGVNVVVLLAVMAWSATALHNTALLQPASGASGWAVVSWLIPVANLIVPPRLLGRVRSVQCSAFEARHRPRANNTVIALWWLLQLTVVGLAIFDWMTRQLPLVADLHTTRLRLRLSLLLGGLTIAAALALLAVVAMITLTNEQLRRVPAVIDAELPGPPAAPIPLRPHTVSAYPSSIFPTAVHPSDPRWKPTPPQDQPPSGSSYWG